MAGSWLRRGNARMTPGPAAVCAALLGTLLGTLLASAPPASAQGTQPFVREDFTLEGAGGVGLSASIWVPTGHGPEPFPAILTTNGWLKRHDASETLHDAEHWAAAGYVVLAYTSRGWGESEGEIELDGPNEVADARLAVDYLANRSEVLLDAPGDPRMAMTGESYAGGATLLLAREEPRIDAVVPRITWMSLLDSLAPQEVLKFGWATLLFGTGHVVGRGLDQGYGGDPVEPNVSGPSSKLNEWYATIVAENGVDDAIAEEVGVVRSLQPGELSTPTFLVQGWRDTLFPPSQALATYEDLRSRGVPVRLMFHERAHGGWGFTDESYGDFYPVIDDWLNVTLRGQPAQLPPYPIVRERLVEEDYVGELQWPPNGANVTRLYLSGEALEADAGDVSVQLLNPVLATACNEVPQFQDEATFCPMGADSTAVVFAAAPFAEDTEVTGTPRLHLRFTSSQSTDARLFFAITDVDEDGESVPVLRQTTPVRTAGGGQELDIDLESITHTFAAGHAIGLQVATTDLAFLESREPGVITLLASADDPSWVEFPVVPKDAFGDRWGPSIRSMAIGCLNDDGATPEAEIDHVVEMVLGDDLALGHARVTWPNGTTTIEPLEGTLDTLRLVAEDNQTVAFTLWDLAGNPNRSVQQDPHVFEVGAIGRCYLPVESTRPTPSGKGEGTPGVGVGLLALALLAVAAVAARLMPRRR